MMFGGGMILGWLILIVAGYFVVKYLIDQNKTQSRQADAISILKKRYANGEIDHQEFEERRNRLIQNNINE